MQTAAFNDDAVQWCRCLGRSDLHNMTIGLSVALSRAQFSTHRTVWLLFSQNARAGHFGSTKETTVAKSTEVEEIAI